MTLPVDTAALDGADAFTAHGWTGDQWQNLYDRFNNSNEPGALAMKLWMRHSRPSFDNPDLVITPDMVLDVFTRHPKHATAVLTTMGMGASERFMVAFLGPLWHSGTVPAAIAAWQYATDQLGLTEPQATGWAATGFLETKVHVARQWVRQVGSNAYLWVLAGFTLDEAVDLQQTRPVITEQQLRVMAALNGVALPDGI